MGAAIYGGGGWGGGNNGPHNNYGVPATGTNQGVLEGCPPCGGNIDGSPSDYMWMNFPKRQRLNFMVVSTLTVALTIFHFGVSASANNFIRYVNDLNTITSTYKTFSQFGPLNGGSYWGGVAPCIAGVLGIVAVNAKKASRAFVIAAAILSGLGIIIGIFAIVVDSAFVSWWAYTAPVTCGTSAFTDKPLQQVTYFGNMDSTLQVCASPTSLRHSPPPLSLPLPHPMALAIDALKVCASPTCHLPLNTSLHLIRLPRCTFVRFLTRPLVFIHHPCNRFRSSLTTDITHITHSTHLLPLQAAVNTCITYFTDPTTGAFSGSASYNDCYCVTNNFNPTGGYTTTGQPLTTGKCLDIKLALYRPDIGNYGSTNAVVTNQNPNGVVKQNMAGYNNCNNVLMQVCPVNMDSPSSLAFFIFTFTHIDRRDGPDDSIPPDDPISLFTHTVPRTFHSTP